MKKLTLLIVLFVSLCAFSQEKIQQVIGGTWVSEDTKYELVVSPRGDRKSFKFLNHKVIIHWSKNGPKATLWLPPETFYKINYKNNTIKTKLSRNNKQNKKGEFFCVYEVISHNKLKATIKDSCDIVLYYIRKN